MEGSGKYSTRDPQNNRAFSKTRYRKQQNSTSAYLFTGDEVAEATL